MFLNLFSSFRYRRLCTACWKKNSGGEKAEKDQYVLMINHDQFINYDQYSEFVVVYKNVLQ